MQALDQSVGLMNMKYRAQIMGATLALDTRDGKGTRVILVLPVTVRDGGQKLCVTQKFKQWDRRAIASQ